MTIVAIGIPLVVPSNPICAQQTQSRILQQWHTGRDLDLFNRASVSADWTQAKRRERLLEFAKQQKVAVFVDRRVDPNNLINFGKANCTVEQFYWAFAEDQNLGVCKLDDVYYFGPIQTAIPLRILWESLAKENSRLKKSVVNWSAKKAIKTASPVIPAAHLNSLALQSGFKITNPEAIPHDVWAGIDLPPMSIDEHVAIFLVGFNKWFERSADGTRLTIVDIPNLTDGRIAFSNVKNAKDVAKQLKSDFTKLRIRRSSKTITVTGSVSDLADLRRKLISLQVAEQSELSDRTFSLKIPRAPRINVLKKLTEQTGLKLITDDASQDKLKEAIGLEVKDATLSELVKATLDGSGLKFELSDSDLRIYQ